MKNKGKKNKSEIIFNSAYKKTKIILTAYTSNKNQRHIVETILHILLKGDACTNVVPDIQKQLKSNVCPVQFQQACHLAVEKFLSEIASQTLVVRDSERS